jgi:ABC-type multidrug transport system fused ATPase/permease subunit
MLPHGRLLLAVLGAIAATTAMDLAPPWIIRYAVDHVISTADAERIWWWAGGLLVVAVAQGGLDFLRLYAMAYTGQGIVFEIRSAIFEHLSQLSFSFYDRARTGDLMSRVTSDVDTLSEFFGRAAVIVVTNVLTLLGILAILLIWNWRLGLLYLAFIPFMVHGMWIYAQKVRPAMAAVRRKLADLTTVLQEGLSGITIVKVLGREAFEQKRADRQSQALREANITTTRITSKWMPYVNVLMGAGMAAVLWVGGTGVIRGTITIGMLVGFTAYVGMLMRPIRQTGMMLNVLMRSIAAAERVFQLLDTEPDVRDAPGAYALPEVEGRVRLESVGFSYDGRHEALSDVSLDAAPGEMVALVGPSGSGKTTLIHLIPRFYDAREGTITIDGHDTSAVTLRSLRDAIGVALQTVFMFDASIGENIAYGNPAAGHEDVERAARTVQIHDFITSLPMGYDTPVGERGVRLSGGQRQRIALARILLKNPRILVFDEPTSSVDAETERRMQQALHEVRAGRTTFVIAHRLWTVQEADQILVLRDGHVVEHARRTPTRSAHQVLLEAGGFYAELYALQARGEAAMTDEEATR